MNWPGFIKEKMKVANNRKSLGGWKEMGPIFPLYISRIVATIKIVTVPMAAPTRPMDIRGIAMSMTIHIF